MQNTIDIGWFDIDSSSAVLDHGRLPNNQYPSLSVSLGRQTKDHALQRLYNRTISRDRSQNLRSDIASLESQEPVLLADGDIMETERFHSKLKLDAGMGQPVSWDNYSAGRLLQVLWSRLVFLFPVSYIVVYDKYQQGLADRSLDSIESQWSMWYSSGDQTSCDFDRSLSR
ncbi:putative patatin-like phospholipase [Aspergillus flavus]|uniref:Patatin-like phospholipase n=1 Tax=Aspergillus flavus (strain ATCC 200026 / FGSC A1120 / IAM 13836 / NRRL 3357 / JCM 12722 / SRRC 167) TaxID=332952 RepID=A0A7U2MCR4_ASPFN|nr:putative patatin-like phospholipase [Aspergillus flavus]